MLAKRMFDVSGSVLGLVALSPLLGITIAIRPREVRELAILTDRSMVRSAGLSARVIYLERPDLSVGVPLSS